MMSTQHAIWSSAEESAFVGFLVEHRAEAGDGGNFKTGTFQKALGHIAPFHERGGAKNVKTLRNKWTSVRLSLFSMPTDSQVFIHSSARFITLSWRSSLSPAGFGVMTLVLASQ